MQMNSALNIYASTWLESLQNKLITDFIHTKKSFILNAISYFLNLVFLFIYRGVFGKDEL